MRKEYKSPEMEVVEMNNNDIITTSGFDNNNLMDEYFGNDKDGLKTLIHKILYNIKNPGFFYQKIIESGIFF